MFMLVVKNLPANAGEMQETCLAPSLWKIPGEKEMENSAQDFKWKFLDESWWAAVCEFQNSQDNTEQG